MIMKIKKMIIVMFIVVGFLLSLSIVFGLRQKVNASEDYAENILREWIESHFGSNYNLKQITFTTESKEIGENETCFIIHTQILHTLKLSDINTHPVIAAINAYRELYGDALSQGSKAFIEKLEKQYRDNLLCYCNEDQELNIRFKVYFPKVGSFGIYIEDPFGGFIEANEYFKPIDSKKLENDFLKSLQSTVPFIEKHYNQIESKSSSMYNPSSAVYYANKYTSETSLWHWCTENGKQTGLSR